MNYQDLDVALSFLNVADYITVQHSYMADRHLLIRHIQKTLGKASRNDYHGLKYGKKYIEFKCLNSVQPNYSLPQYCFFIHRADPSLDAELLPGYSETPVIPIITGYWPGFLKGGMGNA